MHIVKALRHAAQAYACSDGSYPTKLQEQLLDIVKGSSDATAYQYSENEISTSLQVIFCGSLKTAESPADVVVSVASL